MTNTNMDDAPQACCAPVATENAPGEAGCGCGTADGSPCVVKRMIFVIILVAAAAVAIHGFMTGSAETDTSGEPAATPTETSANP